MNKNEKIYRIAKKHLRYKDDNDELQQAMTYLKRSVTLKTSIKLVSEARNQILENDETERKTKLYNANIKIY